MVDNPPTLSVTPIGVDRAITRNAKIPLRVEAADEFGISDGRIELCKSETVLTSTPFEWDSDSRKMMHVDLLQLRRENKLELDETDANSILSIRTFVSDFNPENEEAIGQEYDFEIVSESRFLHLIEREEAGLRARLEDVLLELELAREVLQAHLRNLKLDSDRQSPKNVLDLGPVLLQRVRLQIEKSSSDIKSIANAFGRLIAQLENNRVDVSKKQTRLVNDVKIPMLQLADADFVTFSKRLQREVTSLRRQSDPELLEKDSLAKRVQTARELLVHQDQLINQLDAIVQRLVKFESYGELLDVVRQLIDEQKQIIDQTQKERDRKAFESLLD